MKNFLALSLIVLVAVTSMPLPVSAAMCAPLSGEPTSFLELVCLFLDLISITTPVVAGLALLTFFWGLAKFILHSGDTKSHDAGKQLMMWGTVAIFVMVSVWGLVSVVHSDLFGSRVIGIPRLPQ